jgi:hypothetical protein
MKPTIVLALLLVACSGPADISRDAATPDDGTAASVAVCIHDHHPYVDLEIVYQVLDGAAVMATCKAPSGDKTLWWDERCFIDPCSCTVIEGSQRWD